MLLHRCVSFRVCEAHLDLRYRMSKLYMTLVFLQYVVAYESKPKKKTNEIKIVDKNSILLQKLAIFKSQLTSHVDFRADLYPQTLHMNGLIRL